MEQKPKVTVGIPAYNEEANINALLNDLLSQNQKKIILNKIIVFSDGSNDKTVQRVKSVKREGVVIIEALERRGVAYGLNTICREAQDEVLVIVNADIQIKDKHFLEKMVKPIIEKQIDLVSCRILEIPPENFFEEVLLTSMEIKRKIFESYKAGINVYTCHGRARAFSKRLYKGINFIFGPAEDSYSYFYCLANKFKYLYAPNTEVYYKLPGNFSDHQKQSLRFSYSIKILAKEFKSEVVKREYAIPIILYIKSFGLFLFRKPVQTIFYLLVLFYLKTQALFVERIEEAWDIAGSSKYLQRSKQL